MTKKAIQKNKHEVSVRKCLRCSVVPCVDFYSSGRKLEGGELYILRMMIKKNLHTPCEVGGLIYSLCKLSEPLTKLLAFPLFIQCIRDLKASAFLLLCGHYRSSMQILRPVIENYLAGVYFDNKLVSAQSEEERKSIQEDLERFCDGKYEIPEEEYLEIYPKQKKRKKLLDHNFLLRWMTNKKLVSGKTKDKLEKRIGLLNRYLHPYFPFTEIAKPSCPECPALVNYDEEEYRHCVELFQDVMTDLLSLIYTYVRSYFPDKLQSEEVKEAVTWLQEIEEVEKDIGMPIIYSKELRNFIKTLS